MSKQSKAQQITRLPTFLIIPHPRPETPRFSVQTINPSCTAQTKAVTRKSYRTFATPGQGSVIGCEGIFRGRVGVPYAGVWVGNGIRDLIR
jgi:hypothetical protein